MMKTLLNDTFGNPAIENHVIFWRTCNAHISTLANTAEQVEGGGMHWLMKDPSASGVISFMNENPICDRTPMSSDEWKPFARRTVGEEARGAQAEAFWLHSWDSKGFNMIDGSRHVKTERHALPFMLFGQPVPMGKWIAQAEEEGIGFPMRIVYAPYERTLLLDIESRNIDVHKAYEAFKATHSSTTNALTAWASHIHTSARIVDEYAPPACKRGALMAFRKRIVEEGKLLETADVVRAIHKQMKKITDEEVQSRLAMSKQEIRSKLIDLFLDLEDVQISSIYGLLKPDSAGDTSSSPTLSMSDMSSLAPPSAQKKLPQELDPSVIGPPPAPQPDIEVPKKKKPGAKGAGKREDKDEVDRAEVEKLRRARVDVMSGRVYPSADSTSADSTSDDHGEHFTVIGGDRALHAVLQRFRNLSSPAQDRAMPEEELFYKACFGKCEQNVLALTNAVQYANRAATNLARARTTYGSSAFRKEGEKQANGLLNAWMEQDFKESEWMVCCCPLAHPAETPACCRSLPERRLVHLRNDNHASHLFGSGTNRRGSYQRSVPPMWAWPRPSVSTQWSSCTCSTARHTTSALSIFASRPPQSIQLLRIHREPRPPEN